MGILTAMRDRALVPFDRMEAMSQIHAIAARIQQHRDQLYDTNAELREYIEQLESDVLALKRECAAKDAELEGLRRYGGFVHDRLVFGASSGRPLSQTEMVILHNRAIMAGRARTLEQGRGLLSSQRESDLRQGIAEIRDWTVRLVHKELARRRTLAVQRLASQSPSSMAPVQT